MVNGESGSINLWHKCFGFQTFEVDEIHLINDDDRIGVRIHNQDIYIYRKDIVELKINENEFYVVSNNQKIKIILK